MAITVTIPKLITEARRALADADALILALRADIIKATSDLRDAEKRRAQLKTRLEALQAIKTEAS